MRGAFSGYYPYPFVDVTKPGYPQALLNCLGIAVAFVIISLLFVGIDKLIGKDLPGNYRAL
ncbi:Pr6Pr family membrane protein [Mucilaginibacter sp. McL0603]|uniref:Pr6Pr family membrane protein n=1 Tax=Mucilaginibacter sp. McL0603 TaxID=3415670 RepID=UPI003CEFFFBB